MSWTAGGGGALGGSGTAGKIAKWSATSTLTDSILTESGVNISVAGNVNVSGATSKFGLAQWDIRNTSTTFELFDGTVRFSLTSALGIFKGNLQVDGTMAALDMAGQIDMNGNNIIAGATAAFTTITASAALIRGTSASAIILSGGTSSTQGATIVLYGESHASQAYDIEFRASTTVRLEWDNSELKFTVTGKLTITDLVQTKASHSGAGSPFRIPHGIAPTSLTNGDIWTTTAGLFVYVNGGTVGPLT